MRLSGNDARPPQQMDQALQRLFSLIFFLRFNQNNALASRIVFGWVWVKTMISAPVFIALSLLGGMHQQGTNPAKD